MSKKIEKNISPTNIVYNTVGNRKQRRDNLFRAEASLISAEINSSEKGQIDDDLHLNDAAKNIPTSTSTSTSTSSEVKNEKIDVSKILPTDTDGVNKDMIIKENKNINSFQKIINKINSIISKTVLMSFIVNFG